MINRVICWIDDNPSFLIGVARSIFPRLWKEKVNSSIIFFGDGHKVEKDDRDFDDRICDIVMDELAEIASDVAKEDQLNFPIDIEDVKLIDINIEMNKQILEKWKNIDINYDDDFIEESLQDVNTILGDYLHSDNISEHITYALDLELLYGDFNRLTIKRTPIISMAIYNYFIKNKSPCFLYSTNAYKERQFVRNWNEVYKDCFKQKTEKDVHVIHRRDITVKGFKQDAYNHILKAIDFSKEDE